MIIYANRQYDNRLLQFAGKDIWVKVYKRNNLTLGRNAMYIRILSSNGYRITYNKVPASLVEGKYNINFNGNTLGTMINETWSSSVDDFEIPSNVETLSTEELMDMVEVNC